LHQFTQRLFFWLKVNSARYFDLSGTLHKMSSERARHWDMMPGKIQYQLHFMRESVHSCVN